MGIYERKANVGFGVGGRRLLSETMILQTDKRINKNLSYKFDKKVKAAFLIRNPGAVERNGEI